MCRTIQKTISFILSIGLILTCVTSPGSFAQGLDSDFEAPVIEHQQLETGFAEDDQVFTATVLDNEEVKKVTLFYRFSGDDAFTELDMKLALEESLYTSTLKIENNSVSEIQYYIQAEDASNNIVLKGFAFEPLVRLINAGSEAQATAPPSSDAVKQTAQKGKVNLLYVALGILAVGAIAGAAGGGSSSAAESCVECDITLTIMPIQ